MSSVTHRLLIRHPSRHAILVERGADMPHLPSFEDGADRHTAEVAYINDAVARRWGLATTVLNSLRYDVDERTRRVVRTHELLVHAGEPQAGEGLRWCGAEIASALPPDDAAIAGEWFDTPPAADAPEWTRPGWFSEARAWIEQNARQRADAGVREIVQLRCWGSSCVLQVHTTAGELYFKAVRAGCPEFALTDYLANAFADALPPLLAANPKSRWLLMRGFAGSRLEEVADLPAWQRAAAMYARLQIACIARAPDLRKLGCPERSLEQLAAGIAPLAADESALRSGADGLSNNELTRLRGLVPHLRRRCEALAAGSIPVSLDHGDLWPGNFLIAGENCVLIDWEDSAVGHPFFSLAPLLVGLSVFQPAMDTLPARQAIEDAYLSAFAPRGTPGALRSALTLATPLAFLDMALRYRREPPSMVRLHPWMRDLVPQTVRLALGSI